MPSKPKAVLISDIHFTPQTLEIASEAFLMAQEKAIELGVYLIVCGDTLDTKDIMRAQCVNRIIDLVESKPNLSHFFLVGNHDMVNEKATSHSLRFLSHLNNAFPIQHPLGYDGLYFIPYQTSQEKFAELVTPNNGIIICHQGLQGAKMGHYIQDKTSISPDKLPGKRIISGHYHARQDIPLPDGGAWSYVGNPYTLSFGEAKDPSKGFQILMEDGTLEFVPTKLRKHVIIECNLDMIPNRLATKHFVNPQDIIWLKLTGPYLDLERLNKNELGNTLFGHSNFRFDKIPTDTTPLEVSCIHPLSQKSKMNLLTQLIDNTDESMLSKQQLKDLAEELLNEN